MKKTVYAFFAVLLIVVLCSAFALMSSAASICGAVTSGSNIGRQDYVYNWARNIQSYLEVLSDGRLMRVQGADDSGIGVEYYNSAFQLTRAFSVAEELPLFGGFYANNGYYYILSGKSNHDENDSAEVFRLTKYDTSWNRISSCSLYGANTYDPFDAGTARFSSYGKYVFIHTCHTMFTSEDGRNHQANVMIQVDTSSMTVTDSYYIVMNSAYGYCSHSFNQFVTVDGGKLISVNHGDAHPRSVVLMKYNNSDISSGRFSGGNVSNYTMLGIKGETGANYTGVKVGGFETSSSSYLVAGTTISQKETPEFAGSNVFVSVLDKSSGSVSLKYITHYSDESISISAPQLVPTGSDSFVLMWNIGEKLYICRLDAAGNLVGSIQNVNANLSDCKPIIYNGRIVWYTFVNSEVAFYSINTSNLSSLSVSKTDNDHAWKKVSTGSDGVSTFRCENCSKTMQGKTPTSMNVWWVVSSNGNSTSYTSYINTNVDSNTSSPGYDVDFYGGDSALNVLSVKSSDPSVARVNDNGYIDFLKGGTATVTFSCLYDPSLKKEFTFSVSHVFDDGVVTLAATCAATGVKTYTCTVCNAKKTETIAKNPSNHTGGTEVKNKKTATCGAAGYSGDIYCKGCGAKLSSGATIAMTGKHTWNSGVVTKAATCSATGVKTYTCTVCKTTKTETIAKIAHKEQTIPAVAATCTKTGLTEGKKCAVCGTILTAQKTVAKKAHTSIVIPAKAATCTATGLTEGSKCSVCGTILTAQKTVAKKAHTPVVIPVKAATCTATGLTEGSKCSVCGTILTAQKTVAKKAHTPVVIPAKAATCTATGLNEGSKCSVCGTILTAQKTVKALGHKWDDGKVTKAATYKATGVKTYTCTVCKATKTEKISKLTAPTVAKVSGLKASKVKTNAITLKWSKAKNADTYKVYRSADGKKWSKITTTTKLTYIDKDVKAGKKYQYKVIGIHSASKAKGEYSKVLKTGTLIAAPKISKLTSTKAKNATVTWKKVTGAKSYIVYTSKDGNKFTKATTTTKTTVTLSKLTPGKKVYVKVVAVNAYGKNSAYSAVKSVTVKK